MEESLKSERFSAMDSTMAETISEPFKFVVSLREKYHTYFLPCAKSPVSTALAAALANVVSNLIEKVNFKIMAATMVYPKSPSVAKMNFNPKYMGTAHKPMTA